MPYMTIWWDGSSTSLRHVCAFLALAAGVLAAGCAGSVPPVRPALSADKRLEFAWDFAAAITNDDKDRARAMERVARVWLERGRPDVAAALARQIPHWRGAAVLADAASLHLERGEVPEGRALFEEASTRAIEVTDWPRDRLQMHLARTAALMTNVAGLVEVHHRYLLEADERGRSRAALALALGRAGRTAEAERVLADLGPKAAYEDRYWQVRGHLWLAGLADAPAGCPKRWLDLAWAAAGDVPGWKAYEARLDVLDAAAAEWADAERMSRMTALTEEVRRLPLPLHLRAPLLARVAQSWGRLGRIEWVKELLADVEAPVENELQNIERPGIWAEFAAAAALAGDAATADALFGRAVAAALPLVNLRPRALAAVDIAVAAARSGHQSNALMDGLSRLRATFHGG